MLAHAPLRMWSRRFRSNFQRFSRVRICQWVRRTKNYCISVLEKMLAHVHKTFSNFPVLVSAGKLGKWTTCSKILFHLFKAHPKRLSTNFPGPHLPVSEEHPHYFYEKSSLTISGFDSASEWGESLAHATHENFPGSDFTPVSEVEHHILPNGYFNILIQFIQL